MVGHECLSSNGHNVPNVKNIPKEDIFLNGKDTHSANTFPSLHTNKDDSREKEIEKELNKMCDDIIEFSAKRNSKNKRIIVKNRKQKRRALLIKLFGNPIDDVEINSSRNSNNILQKGRHRLPVSINIENSDFMKPLKINQKRKSETDPQLGSTKLPKDLKEPRTSSIDLPELNFSVVDLIIPTIFKEKAIVTFSEELNVAKVTDKPSVVDYITMEDSSIIDLTLDNSFENGSRVSEFNGIRLEIVKDVKEETGHNNFSEQANVPASKALPPILSPASATGAPIADLVIPQGTTLIPLNQNAASERAPPVQKQKSLDQSGRNEKKQKIQHQQSLDETSLRRNYQNLLQKQLGYNLGEIAKLSPTDFQELLKFPQFNSNPSEISSMGLQNANLNFLAQQNRVLFSDQPNTQQKQSLLADQLMRIQQTGSTSQLPPGNQSTTNKQRLMSQVANQSSQQNQKQLILLVQQKESNLSTVSGNQKIQQNKNSASVKSKSTGTNPFQQKEFHHNPSALLNQQQKAHSISCYQKHQQNIASSVQAQFQKSVSTAQVLPSFQNQYHNGTALLSQPTQPAVITGHRTQASNHLNHFNQIVSPPSQPTPINQYHPPQLRNLLRSSCGPLEFHQISNEVCTEKILPHFRIFICYVMAATNFTELIRYCFNEEESKIERDKFRDYWRSCSKMLGRKLVRDLSTVDVAGLDVCDLVGSLRDKLMQDQISITRPKVLKYLTTMVSDNRDQCNTPFLKKFLHVLLACTQKMEEKTVPIFSVAQLKCLEVQIRQYLLINNWLRANLKHQTTVRLHQPNQEQSPIPDKSPSTARHQQTKQNPNSDLFVQFNGFFDKANDLQSSQNVKMMMRENSSDGTARANNADDVEKMEGVDIGHHSDLQQSTKVQSESTLRTTEVDVKNEDASEAKVTLGDQIIDLTWIDDCIEEEIMEEMIEDSKSFTFKVEDCAEIGDKGEAAGREVVSPVDSGLGSPVAQRSGDDFKCLCGNRAIYVCVCNSSMYCSSDCQLKDWVDHQKLCFKLQN